MVNSNVYIIGTMTMNITHMWGKGGYIWWMTLQLSRCVRVRYLHMCAKIQVSMVNRCRENPDWGGFDFVTLEISSIFLLSFLEFNFLFLNQHVPNQLSLPADNWRQHTAFVRNSYKIPHLELGQFFLSLGIRLV